MILALLLLAATPTPTPLPLCDPVVVMRDAVCRWPVANTITWSKSGGRTYNTTDEYKYCRKGSCWDTLAEVPTSTPTPRYPTPTPIPTSTPTSRYPTATPVPTAAP